MTTKHIDIAPVTPSNFEVFFSLIVSLANYEKLTPPDDSAKKRLKADAFSESPRYFSSLILFEQKPSGYIIYFETYSSFLAKPTLYLEDLFVLPEYRKLKLGLTAFQFLVKEAERRGCGRIEWQVLDWNQIAIDFYEKLGAKRMKEWYSYRLEENDLIRLEKELKSIL
ncbi:MAG: GNAT family N-acetyltransferase [Chloroherpetonaceae bacterium]|nr:GNAT family N-acetyltransferase [Chloroherpetonaceae bacterium]